MEIITNAAELSKQIAKLKKEGKNIGFVPTMGALHRGHISLVKRAMDMCGSVVVSVFVNPTQFNDLTDLERYPRNLDADVALLAAAGADFLFAPAVEEIYPKGNATPYIINDAELLKLTSVMEGASRKGHFDGVVQVVGRLFDIVKPDKAFFGEKDFQQLAIIKLMTKLQERNIEIVGCPIVRAQSGLALSSRNELLTEVQKQSASAIFSSLTALRKRIEAGGKTGTEIETEIDRTILDINKIEYLCAQYIAVVNSDTLADYNGSGDFRICAAVKCGEVRLIDNL